MAKDPKYDQYESLETGVVTIIYTHIDEPDTGGEYSDDKYKCTIVLQRGDEASEEIIEAIERLVPQHFEYVKSELENSTSAKERKMADVIVEHSPIKEEYKDEQATGRLLVVAKTKRQPPVFDARGRRISPVPNIGYNSRVILRLSLAPFKFPAKPPQVPLGGTTVYLQGVQIIELKTTDVSFAPREGYEWAPPPEANNSGSYHKAGSYHDEVMARDREDFGEHMYEPDDETPF